MKKYFSSKICIFLSSSTLILSIFALILLNGSTAWFAESERVTADGMHIKVSSPNNLVESVQYFPISSITLSGNYNIYTFSLEDEITDTTQIKLGTFSTLESERQLLIKINLSQEVDSVIVSAEAEAESYIIEAEDTVINMKGNPLSSVIEFYCVSDVEEENGCYVISGEDIVDSVTRFAEKANGETPFDFNNKKELYSTAVGDSDNFIFIILDYYKLSADYITNHVNGLIMDKLTDVTAGQNVEFVCDFVIVVSS